MGSLVVMLVAASAADAKAEGGWYLRTTGATGIMLSHDQRTAYLFDQPAGLAGAAIARSFRRWLEVWTGTQLAGFFSSRRSPGGLLTASVGPGVRSSGTISAYLRLGLGLGLTGRSTRPFLSADAGLDCLINQRVAVGPAFGLGQLVQWDERRYSSDARYMWLGLSMRISTGRGPRLAMAPRAAERAVVVESKELPEPPPVDPGPDIVELIERTIRPATHRLELLAPVLFETGKAELTPTSIAMLHEVTAILRGRSSIELVEVRGYADERGTLQVNRALSRLRAERVREWLVEHGVAAERLTVASFGETELRETSGGAQAHEQNRRVVFSILRERTSTP